MSNKTDSKQPHIIACGIDSGQLIRFTVSGQGSNLSFEPEDVILCGIDANNDIKIISPNTVGIFK